MSPLNKVRTLALAAVFAFGLGTKGYSEDPTWTAEYDIWVYALGRYPLEYWVNAHDNDGDLVHIFALAYDEYHQEWRQPSKWSGNNWDQFTYGWGCSLDGQSAVIYAFQDSTNVVWFEGQAPDW